jgi:hypothetical protein
MGIDVARYGNDRTIFTYRSGDTYTGREDFVHQDTITTASLAINRMDEQGIGAEHTLIDVIGVGGGVVDHMVSKGYDVVAFNSAESPEKDAGHLLFRNKRAEAYWGLRLGLQNGTIKLVEDKELIKELLNIRYFVKDKTIQIESKEQLKKRLGYSPDIADSLSLCFYSPESHEIDMHFITLNDRSMDDDIESEMGFNIF